MTLAVGCVLTAVAFASSAGAAGLTCPGGSVLTGPNCVATFSYTGAPQTFTVPSGITSLTVTTTGASGGVNWQYAPPNCSFCVGAEGGSETGTFTVSPLSQLTVIAGGEGAHALQNNPAAGAGGYGGGGSGGAHGPGGGGGSFVFGPVGLMIAAGGGGGQGGGGGYSGGGGAGGGTAGGASGQNARVGSGDTPDDYGRGGGGATSAAGGAGGAGGTSHGDSTGPAGTDGNGPASSPSAFGIGGTGGSALSGADGGGAGGGGGYFAAGGGGASIYSGGGGGGGSGYILPSATSATSQSGVGLDNGQVTITFSALPAGVTISADNAVPEPSGGSEPATFTITLPGAQSSDTTVDYETIDATATAAANDYTAVPDGSVTIPAGDPSAQVDVQVDSGSGQSTTQTKNFQVQLTSSSGPPISSTGAVADETITVPGIGGTLTDAAGQEQGGIQVTLTGTADTGQAVFQQTTSDGLGRYQFYTDPGTYALTLAPPPGGNGTTDFEPAPLSCPGGARPGGCDDIQLGEGNATIDFTVLTLEIGSVDPASGSPIGGNEMTIVGSGFGPAGSVDSVVFCALGGSCVDYNAVAFSDSLITLKIPEETQDIAAADGHATVEVQELADNGPALSSNQVPFNYKLRVDSIDPKRVSPAGGDEVLIKGRGFGPAGTLDQVHFFPAHGDGVEARHVKVLSDSRIKVKIPEEDKSFAHNGGRGAFVVAVPILHDVVISNRTDFRYEVKIDSIAPKSASATGGKEMAIKGSGFGPNGTADKVVFCAAHARCVSADDVKVLSDDRITAKIPREEKHPAHADGSETVSVVVPIAGKKDMVDSNRVRFKYQS